jgi:hypothetical protein
LFVLFVHFVTGNLDAAIKEAVLAGLAEHFSAKEARTIACSGASQATVTKLLESLAVKVFIGSDPIIEGDCPHFEPFDWKERNEDDPGAMAELGSHLFVQLKKFGARLDAADVCVSGYKLVDVHKSAHLLDVNDEKLAKISGGTDFLVLPQLVAQESYASAACIILEAKTKSRLDREGLARNIPQLIVEIIAARYHSDQPNVMAVLSDFSANTCVMVFAYDQTADVLSIVKHINLPLDKLGVLIASHLSNGASSVPSATYVPSRVGEPKPEEALVRACKRKWHTDLLSTVAWEHFEEMMPDTMPFSAERRALSNQLFRAWGFDVSGADPVDNSASMYI